MESSRLGEESMITDVRNIFTLKKLDVTIFKKKNNIYRLEKN